MSSFWRCYYHIIWTTKHRAPLIMPEIEPILFDAIRRKCAELECSVLTLNAVSDHVHVAVSIPPKIAVAQWVKHVKGTSSYAINAHFPNTETRFRWQNGYSALTFGARTITFVTEYIDNQKQHHADGSIEPYMERVDEI